MYSQFNDKSFMSICSEKTLQTNEKGFFMIFADRVAENAGEDWIKNVFGKLKTDKERIRIIYEYEKTKNPIVEILSNVQEIYRKKSAQISQKTRLDGENLWKNGDYKRALGFFSQSVIRAPKTGQIPSVDNGESLAFALIGRSKVLMQLNDYGLALRDLQLAQKEGLPIVLRAEVFWRMAICYKALGENKKFEVSYAIAEKLIKKKDFFKLSENEKNKVYKQKQVCNRKVEPHLTGTPNSMFACASHKLTVKESSGLGRYVVASEKINTGDTLVVETPYASCLLPEMFGTHCHHCFERLAAPVPCSDCSNVAFCSNECKETATYHKYECKFLELMIGSGMSILSHTALRIVTQNSLERMLQIYKNQSKERVYSMCTNSSIRPATDFFQRTLMAAFLLRILQKSGYFGADRDELIPNEEELQVGELLTFHLQMLQFNAHEIYETLHTSEKRFRDSKAAYIGVAIYPTVSLFNHDCYPAVARYFVGRKIVIKALRPLSNQNVVAENYGPIFTRRTITNRQRSLSSRYWFKCQCEACIQNWPSLDTGLDTVCPKVKCVTKKCFYYFTLPLSKITVKCPKCEKNVNLSEHISKLQWCLEQYELGFKALEDEDPELGIKILCPAIDSFHRISRPPNKETHLAQETLRALMADYGNTSATLKLNGDK